MGRLQVQPELYRCVEVAGEAQGSIAGDAASPVEDFANSSGRDPSLKSEMVCADLHWDEEILAQNRPGVRGDLLYAPSIYWSLDRHNVITLSAIIDDLDLFRTVRSPDEADTPLIVDANAMWPLRLPDSASNRFPGGTRRSLRTAAAST